MEEIILKYIYRACSIHQESVIELLGFRLVGGRVNALNVTYTPLPKKLTFIRPPRLSTLTNKNDFGEHNLVFSWQKTALTFTVMQHEPA